MAPFEGRYRYVGYDLFPAVRLALREANRAGGVRGVFVELVAYDDGADPAMAREQAHKLALDPQVVAVIGHFGPATTAAAGPVYVGAQLVLLAPALLAPIDGAMLPPGADAQTLAEALLTGVGRAALVTDGGALGRALAATGGDRLMLVTAPDAPGWIESVLAADPPVVLCATDPLTAGEVAHALRAAGWAGTFVGGPELAAADFAAIAGSAAAGARFATPWPLPADVEGGAEFIAAYAEVSSGAPPGPLALPAYHATRLVLSAIETDIAARGRPTRAGVAAALTALLEVQVTDRLYWYSIDADGIARIETD